MSYEQDDHLPTEARRRLDAIRARAVQERSLRLAVTEEQRAAAEQKLRCADEVSRIKRYLGTKATVEAQHKAAKALDAAQIALENVNARIAKLPSSAAALAGRVEAVVKRLRGPLAERGLRPPVAAAKPVKFALLKNESPMQAVERLRAELREHMADLRECRAANRTASEAKASIRAVVEDLAAVGAPNVLGAIEGGATIAWSRESMEQRIISAGCGPVPGAFALVAWLAKDSLIERLSAEVDELADDSRALDAATRGYREHELLDKMLSAERQEVAAIEAAEQGGVQIHHRSDVDVRAVLGLADNVEVQ